MLSPALKSNGAPVFDIALIFAANINYESQKAYLYNNPQVQATLDNIDTLVRPLQAKGIKVSLSVLGNHQGAGFANFATAVRPARSRPNWPAPSTGTAWTASTSMTSGRSTATTALPSPTTGRSCTCASNFVG